MATAARAGTLLAVAIALAQSALMLGCGGDDAGRRGERLPAEGLVEAAGAGDLAAVRRLISDGADVDARDGRGRTAVTAAR